MHHKKAFFACLVIVSDVQKSRKPLVLSFQKKILILKGSSKFFTDPPENVKLELERSEQSVTITCTADARPAPSFKIFLNETMLVKSDKTYLIPKVNSTHVGNYTCVAANLLGNTSSPPEYLSLKGKIDILHQMTNILIFLLKYFGCFCMFCQLK